MISPKSTKYDSRKSMKSLAPIPVIPITIPRPVPTGASRRTCAKVGRNCQSKVAGDEHTRRKKTLARISKIAFRTQSVPNEQDHLEVEVLPALLLLPL